VITQEAIVAEARAWIDTPFHHGARLKGVGVDCVGVVVGVARALGIAVEDRAAYPLRPDGSLRPELDRQMLRVAEASTGDVLLMRFEGEPHHVAFFAGETLIHAYARVRRCLEQPFDDYWRAKVRGVYRFRELAP
jgi:NlpC/P60 family putative phage cell wall peptidase